MKPQLKCMSDKALDEFKKSVYSDLGLYVKKTIHDDFDRDDYSIPLDIEYDKNILKELNLHTEKGSRNNDLESSKIVGESLNKITPSLANEQRIWVQITHTDCWEYTRNRWLQGVSEEEEIRKAIESHIFSPSRGRVRDHQSVARLWWNWYIAKISWPSNPERALELILYESYVRNNFVKRFWLCSRRKIAGAVLRAMDSYKLVLKRENFSLFMKSINRNGGGIVFEAFTDEECDEFVERCLNDAKNAK